MTSEAVELEPAGGHSPLFGLATTDAVFPAVQRRPSIDAASVVALQRIHGNAHVQRLLAGSTAAPVPAADSAPIRPSSEDEHKSLGDIATGGAFGNRAKGRLLRQAKPDDLEARSSTDTANRFDPDSGQPPVHPHSPAIAQAKRKASPAGDIDEQEPDRLANPVVATPPGVMATPVAIGSRTAASSLLRQPTKTKKPAIPLVDDVWKSLLAFSARATPELSRVDKNLTGYLKRYDLAHASFIAVLSEAKKEADERQRWGDLTLGIIIGTGVGLATGGLYTATSVVGKIIYEATGEGAEAGIAGALGGSSSPDFTPPAELNADKVARGYLEKLRHAWKALALTLSAGLAFSKHRDALRDAASGTGPSPKGGAPQPAASKVESDLKRLKEALVVADKALTTFLTTSDTPLLLRDQRAIEQDIWIAWMSRSTENGSAALGDGPIGRKAKELAILGRLVPSSRGFMGRELVEYARNEKARVEQVGHVGVVIVPPTFAFGRASQGVVHIRHDASAAVGRADQTGPEQYSKITWQSRTYLRPGEVVMATSTTPDGLDVKRLGVSLTVAKAERTAAFQLLGIREGDYHPEAAEMVRGPVLIAVSMVNDELRLGYPAGEFKDALRPSSSEDGVLVSEADGTKLILFAPLMPGGIGEARAMRRRSGASRVVAINVGPVRVMEYREEGVVMTERSDSHSLAEEIRDARRAIGRGGRAAKR